MFWRAYNYSRHLNKAYDNDDDDDDYNTQRNNNTKCLTFACAFTKNGSMRCINLSAEF